MIQSMALDPLQLLFIAGGSIISLIIVLAVLAHLRGEKRLREWSKQVAGELGFDHQEQDPALVHRICAQGLPLQGSRSPKAQSIISGTVGDLRVSCCDFSHVVQQGKSSQRVKQTLVLVELSAARFPAFRLGTQTVFHRLGQKFGMHDIDFEEHPAFSRRFTLSGPDEAAIRACFTPDIIERFERLPTGIHVDSSGDRIMFYRPRMRAQSPREMADLIVDGAALASELAGG
jgi:hypothetical protein